MGLTCGATTAAVVRWPGCCEVLHLQECSKSVSVLMLQPFNPPECLPQTLAVASTQTAAARQRVRHDQCVPTLRHATYAGVGGQSHVSGQPLYIPVSHRCASAASCPWSCHPLLCRTSPTTLITQTFVLFQRVLGFQHEDITGLPERHCSSQFG